MELDQVQDVEVGQSSNSDQAQSASESYTPTDPDAAESFVYRSGRRGGLVLSTGSRYSKKSEESSANYYGDDDEDEIRHAKVVLQLLQVIMFHRVAMLRVPNSQRKRTVIGAGASCTVEEGRLPLGTLLDSLRYHIPKLRPLFHRGNLVDHNGISWAPDTATAFKIIALEEDSEIQKSLRLEELTSEVRVLSHGPVQTHPHIIKLLGVAWTRIPSPDGIKADTEERLTPAALLELTPHGSLLKFLHKPESPVSLETKLKLCNDVLLAIQALHACRIAHGDIKAENTLVFKTGDASSEPFLAKLGDFGGAVLNVDEVDRRGFVLTQIRGTPLYNPPELDDSSSLKPQQAMAGDIWCWGMLLWKTIIDGEPYSYNSNEVLGLEAIDFRQMKRLRSQQGFSSMAIDCARRHMERFGESRPRLKDLVYWLLDATLRQEPLQRLDAKELRRHIVQYDQDRLVSHRLLNDYERFASPAKPIAKYPVLDILETYQDLSSFSNLPEVITRELLRQFKDSAVTEEQLAQHRQLALQIGFCHLLGFGLPKQPQIALEYVLKASQMGLPSAQAVAFRLHSLLQQPIEPVACKKWLRDSAMNGSWIAAADYRFLFAAEYHEMNSEIIRKFREQLKQEIEPHTLPRHASLSCGKQIASASMDLGGMSDHLFNSIIRARDKSPNFMKRACLNGDLSLVNLLLQQGADLLQGEQGDNAFHWLIGIDDMDAPDLAERIRQASAVLDINAATYHEIQLSAEPCYFGVMPGGTTPLLWAIARDRWTLVQALLDLGATMPLNIPNSKRLSGINPITWAIQHRALDCLIHLLDQDFSRRHDYINAVDEHEHSPLFYALNSDWKCRLLCTNREPESSYVELEDNILHALIAHGQKSAISLNLSFDQPQAAVISDLHLFQTWSETVGLNDIFFRKETIHGVESQRTMISEAMLYGRVDIFSYMMATLRGREDELQDVISSSAECLPTTFLAQTILDEELLHLCVHAPTAAGVSLALQILDLCPESIDSRDSDGQTPLFKALALGQILLAEVLVERGAGLEVVDNSGCTPLGYAVAQQSIGGVQYLAGQLEKLERPLMAYPKVEFDDTLNPLYWLRGSWFSTTAPVFGYYSVSCLDYIATVEWHDSEHRCDLDRSMYVQDKRTHMHPGCLKLPPTMAFWRILDILLRFELPRKKQRPSIWSSSKQRFFSSDTVTSGLWHGVRYLNEPYVRKVVKSRKFNPEYRVLLDICCRPGWRSINYWHEPEPLEKRSRIIAGYLESQLEEDFRRQRKLQLRTSRLLPARILAKLYYVCYANNHMAAFLRWHKWRIKNAPSVKNPLEFREQNHLPIPFAWFFRLLVWSITLSWMAFVLRIWNDEYTASTEWSAGTQGFGLVYTMLMILLGSFGWWTTIVNFLSLAKRQSSTVSRRYGDRRYGVEFFGFFQFNFCIVKFVMWVYACSYLDPYWGSLVQHFACSPDYPKFRYCEKVTWLKPIPQNANTRNAIKGMSITGGLLITWAVFTQIIPLAFTVRKISGFTRSFNESRTRFPSRERQRARSASNASSFEED